jgi:hypothetical protein
MSLVAEGPLIRATQSLRRYEPGDPAPWQAAARRLAGPLQA